jgi:hypothetical protein
VVVPDYLLDAVMVVEQVALHSMDNIQVVLVVMLVARVHQVLVVVAVVQLLF